MHPSRVAHSIESLPPKKRKFLWSLIDTQNEGEIIAELHDEIQQGLISEISPEELITIIRDLELDEIVDILQILPDQKMKTFCLLCRKEIGKEFEKPYLSRRFSWWSYEY